MLELIRPHGAKLKPLLVKKEELKEAIGKAKSLPQIRMTTRERDHLIKMGIGAFSPPGIHNPRSAGTVRCVP